MSYLVLARKWRPRTFDTLIGQDHVVRALTHALSSGRLHHAWLFTGTRGVGKTTLSRILAKSLNCEQGVTATPCGQCQACTEIDAGRYVDYIELDAASNRGVDEMTQLLEQAVYAPSVGRYKVYMIDEVHMLTGHAFNAMLKTLEEPPEHVKFILATTDPQKIPVTVLSRCLQFNLKQMTVPAIVEHLGHVLADESISAEPQALRLLAQAAAGSMRDALSLTDQAISFAAGPLTASVVGDMLGTLDPHHLVDLVRALAVGDTAAVLAVADELLARGLSFRAALGDLATLLSRVAMTQQLGHAPGDDPQADELAELAGQLDADNLQLFYTVAVHSRAELALAPDEYAGFVMACLRMLALLPADRQAPAPGGRKPSAPRAAPTADDASPATGAAAAEAQAKPAAQTTPEPASRRASVPKPEAAPTRATQSTPEPASAPESDPEPAVAAAAQAHADAMRGDSATMPVTDAAAMPEDVTAVPEDVTAMPEDGPPAWDSDDPLEYTHDLMMEDAALSVLTDADAPSRVATSAPDLTDMTPQKWPELAAQLPVTGAARALAVNSQWIGADEHGIRLRVAIRTLSGGGGQERLCTVLSEHYGQVLRLDIEYGETGADTARAVSEAEQVRRQQAAEQAVQEDSLIQTLVRGFGAQVVPGSVRPA